jgi:hypothetical protein
MAEGDGTCGDDGPKTGRLYTLLHLQYLYLLYCSIVLTFSLSVQGRYTFLGARPTIEMVAQGNKVTVLDHIKGTRQVTVSNGTDK